jgi:hypothetical protein
MTEIKISDEVYAAAGKAMVPFGDDEDLELFEWHHCIDQPNCRGATEPCACSGMPWPSEAVRAAIDAALVASGWRREEDVIREAAEHLRQREREMVERGRHSTQGPYPKPMLTGVTYAADVLSARASDSQSDSPAKPPPDTSWLQTPEVREGDQRREKRNNASRQTGGGSGA